MGLGEGWGFKGNDAVLPHFRGTRHANVWTRAPCGVGGGCRGRALCLIHHGATEAVG